MENSDANRPSLKLHNARYLFQHKCSFEQFGRFVNGDERDSVESYTISSNVLLVHVIIFLDSSLSGIRSARCSTFRCKR